MQVSEGTIIDGRYRVQGRLGSGGMADVYLAEDTHLGRRVAIKVLHARFAQDQEFVERFQREAQAAAGLQHPHVVNVFDRGQFDGTYYIAMEYLEGLSLKDLIERGMTVSEAIEITRQILTAARFAHRNGIVHRDLKPQNVIVSSEGRATVTDFGIARAGVSEITQTGSVMGTAHYLSPEQAQGLEVSAQSDLYSIGVILYEALTGRVPFEADSAVAVALKQVSETPRLPSSLNPQVPAALDAVVMRALAKDPARRFADADEFIAALNAAEAAPDQPRSQDTAVFGAIPVEEAVAEPLPEDLERRRRWPWVTAAILVAAIAAGVAFLLTRPEQVAVPNVTGQPVTLASQILRDKGLDYSLTTVRRRGQPIDTVIEEDPPAGTMVKKGTTIKLSVSAGPGSGRVPSVAGASAQDAAKKLRKAGFGVVVERRYSDSVAEGAAIGTDPPPGTRVRRGTAVRLLVSRGPNLVTVPDVKGLQRSAAESTLQNAGLNVIVDQRDDPAPKDEVIDQSPSAGNQLKRGSSVSITVSTGRQQVTVRDVRGRSQSAATSILQGQGFRVKAVNENVTQQSQDGVVVDQSPQGGNQANKGDTVTIFVGKFQSTTTPTTPTTP